MIKRILDLFTSTPDTEQDYISPNLAAAALLVEVMSADDQWHSDEESAIQTLLSSTLELSNTESNELIAAAKAQQQSAHDLFEMTKQINSHYSPEQKYQLVESMWKVAYADGELDRYEDHTIRKVAELLYLPHDQFIRAKLQAKPE
jgi:uncharacterized tellurite resistance protein B-like protein